MTESKNISTGAAGSGEEAGQPLILFVPGKNPKPSQEAHRAQLLRCLIEGMRRSASSSLQRLEKHPEWFEVLPWNELFYESARDIGEDLPWIDRLLAQPGPSEADRQEAHSWKTRLAWLLYSLGDRVPVLIPLIANPVIRATIEETRRYFRNVDDIGVRIRALLHRRLTEAYDARRPVLLIGHSMGSVIAYDTLWEMGNVHGESRKISLLLTIGSPLGLAFVQNRVLGAREKGRRRFPPLIKEWINISATGELTALDREFSDDYRDMVEFGLVERVKDFHRGVYNYYRDTAGLNVHRSYGYLVNPVTSKAVGDWLERVSAVTHPASASERQESGPS